MKCLLNQIVEMIGLEGVGDIYTQLCEVIDFQIWGGKKNLL